MLGKKETECKIVSEEKEKKENEDDKRKE